MNDKENQDDAETQEQETLVVKLGDDLIAVIRELVQLTLLTGTNVVDHLRAITCEIDNSTNKLIPTEDYVDAYNAMVEQLVKQAQETKEDLDSKEKATITKENLESGNFSLGLDRSDNSNDDVN